MSVIVRAASDYDSCGECSTDGVWVECNPEDATHVALPLDVSQVSDEVARAVGAAALEQAEVARRLMRLGRSREQQAAGYAAIAALAAALAQETT
jgi:hypothetical protein